LALSHIFDKVSADIPFVPFSISAKNWEDISICSANLSRVKDNFSRKRRTRFPIVFLSIATRITLPYILHYCYQRMNKL
jgi:hypothetical protein